MKAGSSTVYTTDFPLKKLSLGSASPLKSSVRAVWLYHRFDHTHPTATKFLCDLVVGNGLADHG